MPFADEFQPVWEQAIKPAIEEGLCGGKKAFSARRADTRTISDSIHRDILDGIAHATLVFADISVMGEGDWKGQRNGNVMFELGIAQTVRPATDLIVVKWDREKITFDISHIRIHDYDRNDLDKARGLFARLLNEAIREREREKNLRVELLRDRLDVDSMNLMVKVCPDGVDFKPFNVNRLTAEERRTAARLLDLDIIRCVCPERRRYQYEWTDFGKYCYQHPNVA